jgi:hypothetical protein
MLVKGFRRRPGVAYAALAPARLRRFPVFLEDGVTNQKHGKCSAGKNRKYNHRAHSDGTYCRKKFQAGIDSFFKFHRCVSAGVGC